MPADLDLPALRRKAEAAHETAPGRWTVVQDADRFAWTDALGIAYLNEYGGESHLAYTTRGFEGDGTEDNSSAQANAAHIAAFDPPTALAMCDEIDSLRAELAEARKVLTFYRDEWRVEAAGKTVDGVEMDEAGWPTAALSDDYGERARAFLSRKSPPPDRVGMIVAYLKDRASEAAVDAGAVWQEGGRASLALHDTLIELADAIERGKPFKGESDG